MDSGHWPSPWQCCKPEMPVPLFYTKISLSISCGRSSFCIVEVGNGILGRALSHSRPEARSHPDKGLASSMCWWGNPQGWVVLLLLGVLGQGQSPERDSRQMAELLRAEIWPWGRGTVRVGGREAGRLAPSERGWWLREPGALLYKWNAS